MKKLIYIAVALFVLVGCNNKEEVGGIQNAPANYGTITGKIELPQDEDAKVGARKINAPEGWETATEAFTMQWESTDKIYIYNDSQSKQLTLKSIDPTGIATFEGELLDDMSSYKVAYGYKPKTKGSFAETVFTVPYVEGNYRPFADGTGAGHNFTITNFGPVIGLKLKGVEELTKIKVLTVSPTTFEILDYTMTFSTPLALNTTTATTVYFPIRTSAPEVTLYFKKTENSEDVTIMTKQLPKAPATNKVTTFSELEVWGTTKTVNGHVGVQMWENGPYWATCNVGATEPEEFGDYFAWGETEPKTEYSWDNYKWCKEYDSKEAIAYLTKYCANSNWGYEGFTDDKTTLEPEDDAAHVHWGGGWRIPTKAEWEELMNKENCTWEETEQNGVPGDLVTSKKTGNSIFLPKNRGEYGQGAYWSSSLYYDDGSFSNGPFGWEFRFYPVTYYELIYGARFSGYGIRPVCK